MNNIDLSRAVKAPFADQSWVNKTLMGALWTLLGVTIPAVYGAQLEYIRNAARGSDSLPEWDEFGNKWVQGLLVMVAGTIYSLPVIVLGAIFAVPVIVAAASEGNSDALAGAAMGGLCVFWVFAFVYLVGISVLFSAAITHFAMTQRFGAFFEFGAIMQRVRSGAGYWQAWMFTILVSIGYSTVSSIVSGITGGIGGILALPITYLMLMSTGNLLGQYAQAAYGVAPAYSPGPPAGYQPPQPGYAPPQPGYAPPQPPTYAPPVSPSAPPASYQPPVPPAAPPTAYEPPAAPVAPPAPPVAPPAPPVAAPPVAPGPSDTAESPEEPPAES